MARRSSQMQKGCRGGDKLRSLPVRQSDSIAAQSLRTFFGCEYLLSLGDENAARMVEIVEVMIVAQQNVVEVRKRVRLESRTLKFPQRKRLCIRRPPRQTWDRLPGPRHRALKMWLGPM